MSAGVLAADFSLPNPLPLEPKTNQIPLSSIKFNASILRVSSPMGRLIPIFDGFPVPIETSRRRLKDNGSDKDTRRAEVMASEVLCHTRIFVVARA